MKSLRRTSNVQRPAIVALLAAAALLAASSSLYAVRPQSWTHQKLSDFTPGQFNNTLVNSLGELTLGRELTEHKLPAPADVIYAFTSGADGVIYFSTFGEKACVYKLVEGKPVAFYKAPKEYDRVEAILDDGNGLLVAVAGESAKLLRVQPSRSGGKPVTTTLFEDADTQDIWAMKKAADGTIYLATGPQGKIWKIDSAGKAAVAFETTGKNVTALALDPQGRLIAGTDAHGLVLRCDPKTSQTFVLLDVGNVDVTALLLDKDANLYVATATPEDNTDRGLEEEEGPGGKSKPSEVTPDINEPDEPNSPPTAPTSRPAPPASRPSKEAPKKSPMKNNTGLLPVTDSDFLAQAAPPLKMPPELKAMLEKNAKNLADKEKKPPASKKSPLNQPPKKNKGMPGFKIEEPPEEEAGSGVYKISPNGTVEKIIAQADMVFALAMQENDLILATGAEGKLFAYNFDTKAQTLLARLNDENIMSMFATPNGTLYLGTSNSATLYSLDSKIAPKGTYLSPVLDAGHTAIWGSAALTATLPANTKATLAVRTGNVRDVKKFEKFWGPWSAEMSASSSPSTEKITAEPAKFLQYRLTLEAADAKLPLVEKVKISYQVQNLPPKIKDLSADTSLLTEDSADADSPREVDISWRGTDPNQDELTYRVLYRQVGSEVWVQIAKDLKEPSYTWNVRSVPDGRYQIKVIATDAADNAPEQALSVAEITPAFLVDNTPPVLDTPTISQKNGVVTITATAKDTASPISQVRYQVDSATDWHPATPSDKIFDSPSEGFTLTTRKLTPGSHRITIKAVDQQGNAALKALDVTVKDEGQ